MQVEVTMGRQMALAAYRFLTCLYERRLRLPEGSGMRHDFACFQTIYYFGSNITQSQAWRFKFSQTQQLGVLSFGFCRCSTSLLRS